MILTGWTFFPVSGRQMKAGYCGPYNRGQQFIDYPWQLLWLILLHRDYHPDWEGMHEHDDSLQELMKSFIPSSLSEQLQAGMDSFCSNCNCLMHECGMHGMTTLIVLIPIAKTFQIRRRSCNRKAFWNCGHQSQP